MYRVVLSLRDPGRVLYLAVPNTTREMLLDEKDMRYILHEFRVHLIFYDPLEEEDLEWIEALSSE